MTLLALEESRNLAEWLRLLAQPQRLMILSALLDGSHAVSEIETMTGIGQPTLSQHLGTLRRSGLIESQRESRAISYCMADTPDAARARMLIMTLRPDGLAVSPTATAPSRKPGAQRSSLEGARFARIVRPLSR
ncbi:MULTISPECIES: ArsR/SmtB family transcription factor [Gluconobacter]|uniref:ArsR family transcriptional regulator n=1 Tax=Gluconobacter cerinus TaxID=38307 RepID=A0A1B6VLH0_9PROT|nr:MULTISPECIES: metalloregulator ArsR/SmtB family transcription factor [Gluconobacter]MBM3097934.1 winged helix-turn-helix transcriptional regulator [Gluconobacter cerinus]MBS0983219.1 winged helix-turn-helix transcriptional regulator [Gluconobacter cerinus]MBS0995256.1 winged helix-turn-helix transcriptional regulator [Gluconobacter cerinus]MBS1017445.1 winged helix-turn-helix transcriptional regulator [Gluconobacter cerinus]MBS1020603.1 winged helix-turn-helix transcriptional regulator [Glu